MNKAAIFFVFAMIFATLPDHACAQVWSDSVEAVNKLYHKGLFDDAELAALRYISRREGPSVEQRAELHRILAFIAIARDDKNDGMEQFLAALKLLPRMTLDRTLTSPKIFAVFEQAKVTFEQTRRQDKDTAEKSMVSYRLRVEAGYRSLIFPGTGQLHKGHRIRGMAYIGAAGVSVIGLAVSHAEVLRRGDRYHECIDPGEASGLYEDYRQAWQFRNGFGATLAAVWIVGVLDGFMTLPAENSVPRITMTVNSQNLVGIRLNIVF